VVLSRNIFVIEYLLKKIKMSIIGNGNASKEQVAAMLNQLLGMDYREKYLDATDALGAAVCHHFQTKSIGSESKKSYGSWKSFLSDNPGRKI
ncbi:MAG: crossover junction endodeoxyribonuclease RuvC, partial [Bacteroidia bacterium]